MKLFRARVRARQPGVVVSVKRGARTRVAVQPKDPSKKPEYYFVTDTRIKIGKRVRKGAALGKI